MTKKKLTEKDIDNMTANELKTNAQRIVGKYTPSTTHEQLRVNRVVNTALLLMKNDDLTIDISANQIARAEGFVKYIAAAIDLQSTAEVMTMQRYAVFDEDENA